MPNITPLHLIVVLVVALLVLGPGKLPEVGAALGKSIREFRKAATDMQEGIAGGVSQSAQAAQPLQPAPAAPVSTSAVAAPSTPVVVASDLPIQSSPEPK